MHEWITFIYGRSVHLTEIETVKIWKVLMHKFCNHFDKFNTSLEIKISGEKNSGHWA